MSGENGAVIHVVTADTPTAKLDTLEVLCARQEKAGPGGDVLEPTVVQVGRGKLPAGRLPLAARIRTPFDQGWLGSRALREVVDERGRRSGDRPLTLHVWSPRALEWCLPLAEARRAVLAEVDLTSDVRDVARWYRLRPQGATLAFICPTAVARQRLAQTGVPPEACVLIRESVDFGVLLRARAANVREQLGLADRDSIILALPPPTRRAGTFTATWAAMLLHEVRPEIRLLIPGEGSEVRRVERLVNSCRRAGMARFVGRRLGLPELLAVADVPTYLPAGDAPVGGLMWAMAAGRPIVASAVPAVSELLVHDQNALLCRPDDPKAVVRRMLQTLERPEDARRRAELARTQAFKLFGRQRMIEQYSRVYANLAAGRDAGDWVQDSAISP